jgi:hypothetical protein
MQEGMVEFKIFGTERMGVESKEIN